jgi:hypothetical protein
MFRVFCLAAALAVASCAVYAPPPSAYPASAAYYPAYPAFPVYGSVVVREGGFHHWH